MYFCFFVVVFVYFCLFFEKIERTRFVLCVSNFTQVRKLRSQVINFESQVRDLKNEFQEDSILDLQKSRDLFSLLKTALDNLMAAACYKAAYLEIKKTSI